MCKSLYHTEFIQPANSVKVGLSSAKDGIINFWMEEPLAYISSTILAILGPTNYFGLQISIYLKGSLRLVFCGNDVYLGRK